MHHHIMPTNQSAQERQNDALGEIYHYPLDNILPNTMNELTDASPSYTVQQNPITTAMPLAMDVRNEMTGMHCMQNTHTVNPMDLYNISSTDAMFSMDLMDVMAATTDTTMNLAWADNMAQANYAVDNTDGLAMSTTPTQNVYSVTIILWFWVGAIPFPNSNQLIRSFM
jgi:hypothetical protein